MVKKESKFAKIDIIIIAVCFAGACLCGAAFWGAYSNTLEKLNEEPVGVIIFQKRVAQRKFIERNIWDRLRQSSLIYNGDTIRTIEQSEAIVILGDEITYLSMGENTMIQVFFDNQKGTQIDFAGGNIDVASENSSIVISSGSSVITVDGQARMERSDEGFVLSVLEGHASFDGKEMETGHILALDPDGTINTNPIITMTSFGSSAYFLGAAGEKTTVEFSWNNFHFNPETYVVVEIASDRRFNNLLEVKEVHDGVSSVSIPMDNGNFWWRAYPVSSENQKPANRFISSGMLEVIPASSVVLLSPVHKTELVFPGMSRIPFSWSAAEGSSFYQLEISANADMRNPVVSRRIESNSLTYDGLNYGLWYWRITPVFPSHIKGQAVPSITGEFTIARIPSLSPIFFSANIDNWNNVAAEIAAANNSVLSQVVRFLETDNELKIRIEGHANPVTNPAFIAGRRQEQIEFLQPMSEARAKKTMELLVERGVDPERIEYRGIGGEQPVTIWEDTRNWWRNRRVEIILY